jgi:DNA polymerase elongation subunit (family B)
MKPWKEANLSIAANGVLFDNSYKGFLPSLMERLYEERKVSKSKMIEAQKRLQKNETQSIKNEIAKYKNQQLVRKVQLNSAYGAIGNQYCRYYDVEIAEAVTISGQLSIRWIEGKLNEFLNETFKTDDFTYVIASDTDSVYIRFGDIIEKICPNKTNQEKVDFLDKCASEIIEPFINKKYDELAEKMNAFANKMFMKREAIADKGIWTAKKRYILNVIDNEGVRYEEPQIKVTGIETTRASTPEVVRKKLKEAINLILTTDEDTVIDFIDEFKTKFFNLPPEDIAFPRGIRGLAKYEDKTKIYSSGTPIATKGALIYNNFIRKNKLNKKIRLIRENDKAKFVYLKEPNPIKERVVTFPDGIPSEFELEGYVDYETQFERGFLRPLEMILTTIGWNNERKTSLEDLFV